MIFLQSNKCLNHPVYFDDSITITLKSPPTIRRRNSIFNYQSATISTKKYERESIDHRSTSSITIDHDINEEIGDLSPLLLRKSFVVLSPTEIPSPSDKQEKKLNNNNNRKRKSSGTQINERKKKKIISSPSLEIINQYEDISNSEGETTVLPTELPKQTFIKNGLRSNYYKTSVDQKFEIYKSKKLVLNVDVVNLLVLFHHSTLEYSNLMMINLLILIIAFPMISIGKINKKLEQILQHFNIKRKNPVNPNKNNHYLTKKSFVMFIQINSNKIFSPVILPKMLQFAIANHRRHVKMVYVLTKLSILNVYQLVLVGQNVVIKKFVKINGLNILKFLILVNMVKVYVQPIQLLKEHFYVNMLEKLLLMKNFMNE